MTPSDEQRAASRAIHHRRTQLARATDEAYNATHRLRDACRDAHAARVPIAHIAFTAGVTRQTVYRWLRGDAP